MKAEQDRQEEAKMRKARIDRKTNETDVCVEINIDGKGEHNVSTSMPFVDHMLSLMAHHGLFDLKLRATGDTEVDYHHLMEDIGITIGSAISEALGDKAGIRRYGFAKIPMDESLAEVVIDLSGRPYLVYNTPPSEGSLRDLPVALFEDFFRALSTHAMMNLHIAVQYGRDLHHIYEAIFKAFGRALNEATSKDKVRRGVPSTKGRL